MIDIEQIINLRFFYLNSKKLKLIGGATLGTIAGILFVCVDLKILIRFFIGAPIVALALFSVEYGIMILLALVILFPRSELFAFSIPFFGGGIKPTDILLICILAGWLFRAFLKNKRTINMSDPITLLILIFVSWSIFSALLSILKGIEYKETLLEVRRILHFLLFIPIYSELRKKNIERIFWLIFIASFMVSVKVIILYFLGIGQTATFTGGTTRVTSLEYLYILFSFLLSLSLYITENKQKTILVGAMIVNIYALIFTFSRASWLGLLPSLIFVFYFSRIQARKRLIKLIVGISLFCLTMYIAFSMRSMQSVFPLNALTTRLASIAKYSSDVAAQHRLNEWRAALEMIQSHPFLGNGLGSRITFFSPMYSVLRKKTGFYQNDIYIHNSYFWIAVKMGLIGLVIFLFMLLTAYRKAIRGIRSGGDNVERTMMIGLVSCFIAITTTSFFELFYFIDNLTPFVAFLFAAINIFCLPDHKPKTNIPRKYYLRES